MAFTKLTEDLNNISALSDRPNDMDGMSAAALKAAFDAAGDSIKQYINEVLTAELDALAADVAANAQAIADFQDLQVADGSIDSNKLATGAVQTANLGELAVSTAKIAALAVTAAKLAAGAVTETKIGSRAVTGPKIALAAILNEHLGSKVVKQANIGDGAVGTNQLASASVTHAKTSGVQKQHSTISYITLPAANWSSKKQTVSASGVKAGNLVHTSWWTANNTTGADNWRRCRDSEIRCIAQGAGTLTFECEAVPSADCRISVDIFD